MTDAMQRTEARASRPSRGLGGHRSSRAGQGATPGDAKLHNRTLVLRTLYVVGPASRADIARATGLTKVTVSGLVAELIAEGLVRELGTQDAQRPGKPAILVDLARDAHAVVCLDLSDHLRFRGAVLDLDGVVLARLDVPRAGAQGEEAVELAAGLAVSLQAAAPVPVLGIGVATPGVVDDRGTVRTAPNLGWTGVPLQQILAERTGAAVVVANDANAAALAEYRFGETGDDFILITIGHGVGSGLILEGHPVTGSSFASGEIGQVIVGTERGIDAPYSREHVLEHWLSVPAIERALAASGEAERERVLRDAGWRLGIALAPVLGVLNLAEVVLAGPADLVTGTLAEATLEMLRHRTMLDSHSDLALHTSAQGEDLVLRGALAIVLKSRLGIT